MYKRQANELKQELINEGLGGNPPARGSGAAGAKEQIIDDLSLIHIYLGDRAVYRAYL